MDDCIFCKIAKKEIPVEVIKETANLLVFQDSEPRAPIHYLIIPKIHVDDMTKVDAVLWEEMRQIALELGENFPGFRIAVNVGDMIEVHHLHMHFVSHKNNEDLNQIQ